jgi:hypothetical protein
MQNLPNAIGRGDGPLTNRQEATHENGTAGMEPTKCGKSFVIRDCHSDSIIAAHDASEMKNR